MQDHTTSNNNGERQGQGQRTPQWGDHSFFQDHHQSLGRPPGCLPVQQRPQLRPQSTGCHPSQDNHEAVAREMAKAHAHYQALLNDRSTATIQTSLKISSGANGFKVMDLFDSTKDKSIYQRWQLWSEKARLTFDAMEGDSESLKPLTSITGLMEREWDTLSHGKTASFYDIWGISLPYC